MSKPTNKPVTFFARFAMPILVVAAVLLPLSVYGSFLTLKSNKNDVKQWLPPEYAETTTFNEFRQLFSGEEFILVSWEGCTLDDDRLKLMAAKLAPEGFGKAHDFPPLYSSVITGPQTVEQMIAPPKGKDGEGQASKLTREMAIDRLRGSLIGPDGKQTCLVVTLNEAGQANLKLAVETIYKTAAEQCNIPRDSLRMGGPPVDNVAIDRAGEESLFRLAGFALAIGLVISWWCLRSLRYVAMVFVTGVYSAAVSLAIVALSGVDMNAILLTMPSLVFVASVSGAIHLTNYYRDTVAEEGAFGAPERAIRHATLPLMLATGTTAFGLASLFFSELVPIKLFGIFSAIGVLVSLVFLFLFLPALFQHWPETPAEKQAAAKPASRWFPDPFASPIWGAMGERVLRHSNLVLAGCLTVMVFCAYAIPSAETSIQMMRMFSPDARIIHDYQWLEDHLGELVPVEVVIRVDQKTNKLNMLERMELVERVQQRINAMESVGSSLSAVTFAPPLDGWKNPGRIPGVRDQVKFKRNIVDRKLKESRARFLDGDYLREDQGEELWRITARVAALADVDYGAFISDLKAEVEPILAEQANAGVEGLDVTYTGLVPLVHQAQRSLLNGLLEGFAVDLIMITLVMMLAVRSISAGLLLILPSIFPCVVVFGLMSWFKIKIDIGTVMTPAVALGVTVDDVVHFMLKYRTALGKGLTRREAVMVAYKGCARAMYQSWGVIGLGLSVFALSPFTPTQRFGYLMVTLLSAALPGNLLLLPSLLVSPLGAYFGRQKKPPAVTLPATTAIDSDTPRPASTLLASRKARPSQDSVRIDKGSRKRK